MKIALFYKPSIIKVYSFFIIFSLIAGTPSFASASFFSDLTAKVFGGDQVKADEIVENDNSTSRGNSQTISLIESSVNYNTKSTENSFLAIVDDEALSSDNLEGTDSETNSYILSADKIITYTVKNGDTLSGIADKFNISMSTILYANTDIKNSVLKIGQVLVILPVDGISYVVKKGDTISSVAKNFKADANDILEYNNISSEKGLQLGSTIIVPGGTIVKKVESVVVPVKNIAINSDISKEQPKVEIQQPKSEVIEKSTINQNTTTSNSITDGYIWPFPAGVGRVSQRLHDDNAYDFAAPKGTPIYAIQDGTVLIADASGYNGGYGLYVVMDFDDGAQAILGHMSAVATFAGKKVKKGEIIGFVGSTGRSTGNHVHIGYRGGKPNPYRNLPLNSKGL